MNIKFLPNRIEILLTIAEVEVLVKGMPVITQGLASNDARALVIKTEGPVAPVKQPPGVAKDKQAFDMLTRENPERNRFFNRPEEE